MSGDDSGNGGADASDSPMVWIEGGGREILTQDEIDSILNDPGLPTAEREARLRELRQRILDDESTSGEESYAPLQVRIMDALAMVADGGHDYDNTLRVEGGESGPTSAATRPDD